ncbi:MAG: polysaccharide biosynthesis protein [Gammaproteobacteria bacterium]|nr:polysaccharide biosynthesis protein [Gammaproteobacteria bacterium]
MSISQKLLRLPRGKKRAILIFSDSIFLPFAFWSAWFLQSGEFSVVTASARWLLLVIPVISVPIFIQLGLYRAVIRYMGAKAFYMIITGVTLSSLSLFVFAAFIHVGQISPAIFIIYWAFALLYIGGSRLLVRDYFHENQWASMQREKVAVYGAGSSGIQLVNGLQSGREYNPVAFVDEKSDLVDTVIKGIKVYSPSALSKVIHSLGITQVLLAIPSASRVRRREILAKLEPLPVYVRTIPGLADLVSGQAQVDDIQEVDIADLLGRDPVPPNEALLFKCIKNKVVMVTGAGGSIGSELCRQMMALAPKRLVLFEASEFALYKIEQELKTLGQKKGHLYRSIDLQCVLGSVTHRRRVASVIRSFGVQTIYHAAAYKHVPLVEHNPIEGVVNNLFGTWRTAWTAMEAEVETFVLVSTDKAVRPTNIMGATKRSAELVLQALAKQQSKTRFCMVRFGNVLGSSGSVVPLFRQQIRQGGPITVTHSEITRYFMTIPEAAQLVLQAGAMAQGGDVFVLDMGETVKIADLARRMIKLSGLKVCDSDNPDGDIAIVFTGLRPGEKLYEELLIGDNVSGTDHPRIMRAKELEIPWEELSKILVTLETASVAFDSEKVRNILKTMVSGYVPQCDIVDPVWQLMKINHEFKKVSKLVNVEGLNSSRAVS